MSSEVKEIGFLSRNELLDAGLFWFERLRLSFFEDGSAVPIALDLNILDPEDWRRISRKIDRFYAQIPTEYLERHRARIDTIKWRNAGLDIDELPKDYTINPKRKGWVYVLEAGPYYKIGRSKYVDKRVEQLSTLPPFDIDLIHTIYAYDMCQLELSLHEHFATKRKNGEWFELEEEDIQWLKTL